MMFEKSRSITQQTVSEVLLLVHLATVCWSSLINTYCDFVEGKHLMGLWLLLQTHANLAEPFLFFWNEPLLLIHVWGLLNCCSLFMFNGLDWTADILIMKIGITTKELFLNGSTSPLTY